MLLSELKKSQIPTSDLFFFVSVYHYFFFLFIIILLTFKLFTNLITYNPHSLTHWLTHSLIVLHIFLTSSYVRNHDVIDILFSENAEDIKF